MKKHILNIMFAFVVVCTFCIIGCQNEAVQSGGEKIVYVDRTGDVIYVDRTIDVEKIVYRDRTIDISQGGSQDIKITSLQFAINTAKPSDVIDFTDPKYSTITTIEPSIGINKAVTIKNFPDLGGSQINVASDGVVLSNIGNAGVNTNSSLKISGSSLSSLNIGAVDTGRGEPIVKSRPPKVELLSSDVSSDVIIAIENAALTVFDVTADNIRFDANDTQLTIENKDSAIKNILTGKKCRLVLEDGTSDTIPCSDQKISVSGTGQLTQVNMQAAETLILTKLSPESGLITTMKQDESIDFSPLEVIGTYQKSGAITIYEAGLTYEFVDTVTRLEDVFRIKIGNDTVYTSIGLDENDVRIGQYADFDWTTLQPGYHQAIIEKDFANTALDYRYEFRIAVIDKNVEYHLSDLTVDISNMKKKTYLADETLDLTGLVVKGTYHADAVLAAVDDYEKVLLPSEYTVTPAEGDELTTNVEKNIKVTVSANDSDKSAEFEVTVKPSCYVTFNYGYKVEGNDVKKEMLIEKGTSISEPETAFVRNGYTLKGWYNENRSSQFNFNTPINEGKILYAKWAKTKPIIGAIVYVDATTADENNDRYIYMSEPILNKEPIGIVFDLSGDVNHGNKMVHLSQYDGDIKWCVEDAELYPTEKQAKLAAFENYNGGNPYTEYYDGYSAILTNEYDGSGNWQMICNYVSDETSSGIYPVFEYINDLTTDGKKWYLPSYRELLILKDHFDEVNDVLTTKLTGLGYDIIPLEKKNGSRDVYYWSSNINIYVQDQYTYIRQWEAFCVKLSSTSKNFKDMTFSIDYYNLCSARAIRKFNWQSSTTGNNLYNYE